MLQMVWGWQPALYLFLGGMGAGAFATAAALYLMDKEHHKKAICGTMWASVVCLIVGLILLLTELTNPLRGLMMWQSFSHFSSWMTIGAWGLFAAVIVFGIAAILATARMAKPAEGGSGQAANTAHAKAADLAGRVDGALSVFAIIGIFLGVFVAIYTGLLLMSAPGVPLWNTWLLPCLFTLSAFDTGVALVEIIAVIAAHKEGLTAKVHRFIEVSAIVLIVLELVVLAVFLGTMMGSDVATSTGAAAATSSDMLVSGILAPYFWVMVVAVGLILPLVMAFVGLMLHKGRQSRAVASSLMAIGAIGVLIGGCELRFLILAAGVHANIVTDAISSMIMM